MSRRVKKTAHRAGFVALIGRPNVGKSTLVNALLGQKVSIVTPKPQTTRTRIHGILTVSEAQIILVDTPGLCDERSALRKAMRRIAGDAAAESDVALVVTELRGKTPELQPEDLEVIEEARRGRGHVVVAINKIDKLPQKELLLPLMEKYSKELAVDTIVPISARDGDGLELLQERLIERLPESPQLFPEDMVTDQAERVLCAELVREQLMLKTAQEVPHSAAVVIESFEDGRDAEGRGLCRLEGRIYVERDSQKAIVVGKGGSMIKTISEAARKQIEELLGCKVYLRMTVHVDKDWTQSELAVRRRVESNLPDFG